MTRIALSFLLSASFVFAAVTAEPAGAPPSELDPTIAAALQKEGVRIKDGAKTLMEVWFRNSAPVSGPNEAGDNISFSDVAHGALLAVVRYPEKGADRRGQSMKPGLYTARLSFFPPDGNHQGVSPQRDFLLLSLAAEDKDLKATPDYKALTEMSMKATGTPHPAVLSVWKVDPATFKPGIEAEGEHDMVLQHKIGDMPVALIVAGVFNH
jgi:hypothetical protein